MRKKIALLILLLAVLAFAVIPVNQQKTIRVKASFFNVYQQLAAAGNWAKWRTDLRRARLSDSSKILSTRNTNGFKISHGDLKLNVQVHGYTFVVDEENKKNEYNYSYTVLPGKYPNATSITVMQKTGILNYLLHLHAKKPFNETHINDLKSFMENPDLYYGYKIIKKRVTDTNIVVLRRAVLSKNKFIEAAKMLADLKHFLSLHHLTQTQPLMAQFFNKANDSSQVNIGLPVDRKIKTRYPISFMAMPPTGYLYTAKFSGKFIDRLKAYAAVKRYFNDREMPIPILPFETYLDNKLPATDSDKINIQINFTTF